MPRCLMKKMCIRDSASAGDDGNLLRHIVHSFFFY